MPQGEKASAFGVASLEKQSAAFGRLSVEDKLAQLRKSPIWLQPEGPDFFNYVASADRAFMLDRMAIEDQAVLYERMRAEQAHTLD
jgi:hypothetical protein